MQYALDAGLSRAASNSLVFGIGAGAFVGRIIVMKFADEKWPHKTFTVVLAIAAAAHMLLPVMIKSPSFAMIYAVVIGTATGSFVALVVPVSATLAQHAEDIPQVWTKALDRLMQPSNHALMCCSRHLVSSTLVSPSELPLVPHLRGLFVTRLVPMIWLLFLPAAAVSLARSCVYVSDRLTHGRGVVNAHDCVHAETKA